ncbi:MAG: single-stranded-DNA-specific exonuclease RecJ, partial [Gammaproteobacteria bacterium]|nr:single-stranded-DNA-specific exonuclease RecJ [Gammaproteobacteria bacterium]
MSLQNKKQIEQRPLVAIPADFPGDMHPVLARVFAARNIHSAAELEYGLEHLLPWDTLAGIENALTLLTQALASQQRILIVGDFDADGATSTAVAVRALSM